ncbi:hypothetical protein [Crossiella cryophila]|uniref:Uncharacterized protein n=1 Tax=Crossiella cryophila TaxID=43355 RepID=A0A7W7FW21_9PSEU|nr:hypothetical protein [Crossiella cryophila]MBB4677424.1 hypothetical protein [Crossiella cryophila]
MSGLCTSVRPALAGDHRPWGVRGTNAEGRYTISFLGPYGWRVQFPDMKGDYAWQWSGAAPDRFGATQVRATASETTRSMPGSSPPAR